MSVVAAKQAGSVSRGRARAPGLVTNLLAVGGTTVLIRLLNLVILSYAGRVLGPDSFGKWGFAVAVVAYASMLLSPGMAQWGTRAVAQDHGRASRTLVEINGIQFVLACLAYAGLVGAAACFWQDAILRPLILVQGASLFVVAVSVDWVFNGFEQMRVPALLNLLNYALQVAGYLLWVRRPEHLLRFALIGLVCSLLTTLMGYVALRKLVRLAFVVPEWKSVTSTLRQSLPLGATMALALALRHANTLSVEHVCAPAMLGCFLAAFRIFELTTTLPNTLVAVFLPRLARLVTHDREGAKTQAQFFARINMTLGFGMAALVAAEAPAIIQLIYGTRYADAALLLRVMSVGIVFNHAVFGYTNCLIPFGKDRALLRCVAASACLSFAGSLLLVPRMGAVGAALTIAGLDLLAWASTLRDYRRAIGGLQMQNWLAPLCGSVLLLCASLALQHTNMPLFARLPVCVLLYLPCALPLLRKS